MVGLCISLVLLIFFSLVETPILRNIFRGYNPLKYLTNSEVNKSSDMLGFEYVIITNNSLATSFEPLIEYKRKEGLKARITTTNEISNNYRGIDLQQKIRYYLMEAYKCGLIWVLLGGDESIIPVRYKDKNISKYCELYYADLDRIWKGDDDSIYSAQKATGSQDIYPDIYLGRIKCNSVECVEKNISNLLSFFQNPRLDLKEIHYLKVSADSVALDSTFLPGENEQIEGTIIEHCVKIDGSNIKITNDDDYDIIDYLDWEKTSNEKEPAIPFKVVKLLIPSDEKVDSVTVLADDTPISGKYRIKNHQYIKNGDTKKRYPDNNIQIIDEGYFGNNHILSLKIFPIVYIPTTLKLEYSPELMIKVFTSSGGLHIPTFESSIPVSSEILSKIVDNFQSGMKYANSYPLSELWTSEIDNSNVKGNLGYEYVIITSAVLAENYRPLMEWKRRKGLVAGIVTTEEIEASYTGIDLQEKIRNYLIEAYEYGLVWVLLGGDETIIPIRYAYQNNTSNRPDQINQQICDLYYSDLTGDWDTDGDGVYGEPSADSPDIYPEIYVGRIPVTTVKEIEEFIQKLLLYEQNPDKGDFSYLTTSLFMSSDQLANANKHKQLGNEMPDNWQFDSSYPTGNDVIRRMNDGFGFISNLHHGSPHHYAAMSNKYNKQADSICLDKDNQKLKYGHLSIIEDNYKYGVHYSISCDVGTIDMDKDSWEWPLPTYNSLKESTVNTNYSVLDSVVLKENWGNISSIVENLHHASLTYNCPPDTMILGETWCVTLLLSFEMSSESLSVRIIEKLPDVYRSESIEMDSARASNTMQANLSGTGFNIQSLTPIQQDISLRDVTEWKWEIEAVKPGLYFLYLTLNAVIVDKEKRKIQTIRTYDNEIFIDVQSKGFPTILHDYLKIIITGIFAIFAVYLGYRLGLRSKK